MRIVIGHLLFVILLATGGALLGFVHVHAGNAALVGFFVGFVSGGLGVILFRCIDEFTYPRQ